MYRQDNDVAKGYLIKALNFLIEEKHITLQQGEKVLNNFNYECDCIRLKMKLLNIIEITF